MINGESYSSIVNAIVKIFSNSCRVAVFILPKLLAPTQECIRIAVRTYTQTLKRPLLPAYLSNGPRAFFVFNFNVISINARVDDRHSRKFVFQTVAHAQGRRSFEKAVKISRISTVTVNSIFHLT